MRTLASKIRRNSFGLGALFVLLALACLGVVTHLERSAPNEIRLPARVFRPPHDVNALLLDGGILWAGGMEGMAGWDPATGKPAAPAPCGLKLELVKAILAGTDGALWIGHANGLTRYAGGDCTTYTTAEGLPSNRVNTIYRDRRGTLWAGTWGGAARLENGSWHALQKAGGLLADMVNVILEDRRGAMWFGSYTVPEGGISILEEGRWQYFTAASGLPHPYITSILEDASGDVWAGTGFMDRGGLVRFHRNAVYSIAQVLTASDGLAGAKVRSLFQDAGGTMWAGSEYDGVARRGAGQWQIWRKGLSHLEVKAFVQDSQGNLWLGTRDGITMLEAAAMRQAP